MAEHKRSKKRPQPKYKKQKKSQHDKRERLERPNPERKKTTSAKVPLAGAMRTAVSALQAVMDRRIAFRLAIVVAGMFLADDRRTASAWFVAAGVQEDWDRFYDCLNRVGRGTATSSQCVVEYWLLALEPMVVHLGRAMLLGNGAIRVDRSPSASLGQPPPSSVARRRLISREMLEKRFLAVLPHTPDERKFRTLFEALIALAI